jgi:hypothetical protein
MSMHPKITSLIDDQSFISFPDLEKYSSAATLSDMEIFVFPQLLYSLVLANIMSPRLWAWRDLTWFAGVESVGEVKRMNRLRQFIMDQYDFNLDLETWGLTTKPIELARFSPFLSSEALSGSNALFGYEGDRHYFSVDLRRHFDLEKYHSDVIPYWKTETIEAMDAFAHKPGFKRGAGECVSLAALYAAAAFVVCRISLSRIFLMATPLHSQNFVCVDHGLITNNRRVVTKSMWFNGTEQSTKAQRALKNEQVTLVSHHTGYIHCVYPEASIDALDYQDFCKSLRDFLSAPVTLELLLNFLRDGSRYQRYFQFRRIARGHTFFIAAETAFAYEHNNPKKLSTVSKSNFLDEFDDDDLFRSPLDNRAIFEELAAHLPRQALFSILDLAPIKDQIQNLLPDVDRFLDDFFAFCKIEPHLPILQPDQALSTIPSMRIDLSHDQSRLDITQYLESIRHANETADLAFYAARDLKRSSLVPFLYAAVVRNPVSIDGCKYLTDDAVVLEIERFYPESIYEDTRLAQPDEVWNFRRGDGLERLICVANILSARHPDAAIHLEPAGDSLRLRVGSREYLATSTKPFSTNVSLSQRPLPAANS